MDTNEAINEQFKTLIVMAESLGDEYSKGYLRGIRRLRHGENFGTEQEHKQYLALDDNHADRRDGYLDGLAGKFPRGFRD